MAEKERDNFYENLINLATTPSPPRDEGHVTELLIDLFDSYCTKVKPDQEGNLYVFRKGEKDGLIAFSAHQDKLTCTDEVGYLVPTIEGLNTNLIFSSSAGKQVLSRKILYEPTFQKVYYNKDLSEIGEGIVIPIPKPTSSLSKYKEYYDLELLDLAQSIPPTGESTIPKKKELEKMVLFPGLLANKTISPDSIFQYSPLVSPVPTQFVEGGLIGKLDDTIGLSLILDVFQNTDPKTTPNLLGVLTVNEERGMTGSTFAAKNVMGKYAQTSPDKMIVLDVTRSKNPGQGIVLYSGCGSLGPKTPVQTSKKEKINIYEGKIPGLRNKSRKHRYTQTPTDQPSNLRQKNSSVQVTEQTVPPMIPGRQVTPIINNQKLLPPPLPQADLEEPLIKELRLYAEKTRTPISIVPACSNDSRVFASLTKIPTTALEVPVESMHTKNEKASISDIESARSFLRGFVSNG